MCVLLITASDYPFCIFIILLQIEHPVLLKYPRSCDRMVVEIKTTVQSVPIITKVVSSNPARGTR